MAPAWCSVAPATIGIAPDPSPGGTPGIRGRSGSYLVVASRALCDDETDMSSIDTPRRATRSPERGYLGGVAAGLADHLGVDALVLRGLFLLTSVFGFGVLFYAGLWLTLPMEPQTGLSPGLEAATRQGKRPARRRSARDAGALVAMTALVFGVATVADMTIGGGPFLLGPAL